MMDRLKQTLVPGKLKLFVSLPANDVKLANASLAEGADGLKVHIHVGHRASGNHFGPLATYQQIIQDIRGLYDGPLGIVPGGAVEQVSAEEIAALPGLGIDFVSIYAFHMPSFLLRAPGIAKTFAIDDKFDRSLIGNVREFGISALEASIVPGDEYGSPFTLADALAYRRLVQNTDVPVIVPSQRKITSEDVPVLSDCGVSVLLIGAVVTGKEEEGIRRSVSAFREAIDRIG